MTAPTLSVDYSGNTFVKVSFDEYLPGTATVVVQRISDGRTWEARGGLNIATGVGVTDFEAPFGVPSRYRGQCFDAAGAPLGFTDEAEVTVWEERILVHQPLDPQIWASVTALKGTADEIDRPSGGSIVYVEGSVTGRVIGSGRRGVNSLPYTFFVDSVEAADRLQEMLGSYEVQQVPILCIRTPPPMRVPRTFFAHVSSFPEKALDPGRSELFAFPFTATEVDPPYVGLVKPLLTYGALDDAYGSYGLRDAAYASYSEMDQDYALARA